MSGIDHLILNTQNNLLISAGAGTGKTTSLVKRYLAVLYNDYLADRRPRAINLDKVLVVTFTNKAAYNMRSRIFTVINTIIASKTDNGDESLAPYGDIIDRLRQCPVSYLEEIKSALHKQSSIKTIDSFCSEIVRENALAAGIDPGFEVGENIELDMLFDRAFDEMIRFDKKQYENILPKLIESLSISKLKAILRKFVEDRFQAGMVFGNLDNKDDNTVWQSWFEQYSGITSDEIESLAESVLSLLDSSISMLEPVTIHTVESEQFLKNLKNIIELSRDKTTLGKIAFLRELAGFMSSGSGYYKFDRWATYFFGKSSGWNIWDSKDRKKEFQEVFANIVTILPPKEDIECIPWQADFDFVQRARLLKQLYEIFEKRLSKYKARQNTFSFGDIVYRAFLLLQQQKRLREQLQARFQHILIDEFQDTNDIRWEIIKLIAGSGRQHGLFFIGDEKQSIYRFNKADVEIIRKVVEDREYQEEFGFIKSELQDNWRSSKNLIEKCFNPLFRKVFPENPQEKYEASFQKAYFPEIKEEKPDSGCYEVHYMKRNPEENAATRIKKEADYCADLIKNYLESDGGSAAILLRRFANYRYFAEALTRHGVRPLIEGGGGFFQQQEISDIINLLRVLVNSLDDIALLGLLRSPFFTFADDEIYELSKFREKQNWNSLLGCLSGIDGAYYNNCASTIEKWQWKIREIPISSFITDVIRETGYEYGLLLEPFGNRKVANMDKLINMIVTWERKGLNPGALADKLEFLQGNSFGDEMAGSTSFSDDSKNSAIITTIHKSKGLEFDMVIIPEIDAVGDSSASSENILIEKPGEDKWEIGLRFELEGTEVKTGLYGNMSRKRKLEEAAESKRLLYVAATRAKNRLVFTGQQCRKNNNIVDYNKSWADWFGAFYGIDFESIKEDAKSLVLRGPDEDDACNVLLADHEILAGQSVEQAEQIAAIYPADEIHSGKLIKTNPHEVMDRFIKSSIPDSKEEYENKSPYGREIGVVFHFAVQKNLLAAEQRKHLKEYCEDSFAIKWDDIKDDIERHLNSLKRSEYYEIISNNKSCIKELPISCSFRIGEDIISINAVVDLLYYKDSKWVLVDYKTGPEHSAEMEKYKLQLRIYRFLLKSVYNINPDCRLFYTATGNSIEVDEQEGIERIILGRDDAEIHFANSNPVPAKLSRLLEKYKNRKIIIITPTKRKSDILRDSLISAQSLTPFTGIMTFDEFIGEFSLRQKARDIKIKTAIHEFLSKSEYVKSNFEAGGIDSYPSLADLLFEAWNRSKSHLVNYNSEPLLREFDKFAAEKGIVSKWELAGDVLNNPELQDAVIILDGYYFSRPVEEQFFTDLSSGSLFGQSNITLEFLPNNSLYKGFPINSARYYKKFQLSKVNNEYHYFNSVYQELGQMFREIRWVIAEQGISLDCIKIILPGMDSYLPAVKAAAADIGVPLFCQKSPKLIELPPANMILEMIDLFEENQDIDRFLALLRKGWFSPGFDIAKLSLYVYRNEIKTIDELKNDDNMTASEDAAIFLELTGLFDISGLPVSGLESRIKDILGRLGYNGNEAGNSQGNNIVTKVLGIISEVTGSYLSGYSALNNLGLLKRLLIGQLKEEAAAGRENMLGIEVLGAFDSIDVTGMYLFVPGLNVNNFPIPLRRPYFLKEAVSDLFRMNKFIFNSWFRNFESVWLSYSDTNIDGSSVDISPFIEEFCPAVFESKPAAMPRREVFAAMAAGNILPAIDKENMMRCYNKKLLNEKHATGNELSRFEGFIGELGQKTWNMSSQTIDMLASCPMKYLFSRIYRLRPLREDQSAFVRGNIVHHSLEEYTNRGFLSGCRMGKGMSENIMREIITGNILALEGRMPMDDILIADKYKNILSGLDNDSRTGPIKQLLETEAEKFCALEILHTEKAFGKAYPGPGEGEHTWNYLSIKDDNIIINISGKIDRIDRYKGGSRNEFIIACDYKTGKIDKKAVGKTSFQFPLYYLKLRQEFGCPVILFYWQLNPHKKALPDGFFGDLEQANEIPGISCYIYGSSGKMAGKHRDFVVEDSSILESVICEIINTAIKGFFPNIKKHNQAIGNTPCKFCEFSGCCRIRNFELIK